MNKLINLRKAWAKLSAHRAKLRFCLRTTVAGLLAFAIAQLTSIPLNGLWVVLTAVVVSQLSVAGSLCATLEYIIGTVGGATYAGVIGVLLPHTTPIALGGILVLAIAPLALAAAFNPSFRVAPFSAVLVLLISGQLNEGPVESALYRTFEVALGGAIAVAVSLLVFPERAHGLGVDAAARILGQLANALPELLTGFTHNLAGDVIRRIQDDIGEAVTGLQAITAEAERERLVNLLAEPDPGRLSRILLRLRHDLVIIGRGANRPLPDAIAQRLRPLLARLAADASDFLRNSATALVERRSPPTLDQAEAALQAYRSEIIALRKEGATRALSNEEAERVFALGFGLEQFHRNLADLRRSVEEYAGQSSHIGTAESKTPIAGPADNSSFYGRTRTDR
jgi:uncharacterized membrane protein YccC